MNGNEWIGDAILACDPIEAERIRHLPAPVVKGKVRGRLPTQSDTVTGSFQPITGRELELLPEGMKNRGAWKFYTQADFQTVNVSECGIPDRLVFDGVTYETQRVDDWAHAAGYSKVTLTRVDR